MEGRNNKADEATGNRVEIDEIEYKELNIGTNAIRKITELGKTPWKIITKAGALVTKEEFKTLRAARRWENKNKEWLMTVQIMEIVKRWHENEHKQKTKTE